MPNIQAEIDSNISGQLTKLYFPESVLKYHTYISLEDWRFHNPTTGDLGAQTIVNDIVNEIAQPGYIKTAQDSILTAVDTIRDFAGPTISNIFTGVKLSKNIRAEIRLPLPLQLIDVHRVKYDPKPIAPWEKFARSIFGETAPNVAMGLTGLAPNEFHTILFDRPEFKTHELAFKLSPKSPQEAAMAQRIFVTLNNAMSPGLDVGNFMFTFPKVINVSFRPSPGYLFRFKPAVIHAISTNFAPSGKKAFYHTQYPESIHISMQIQEIEYWINRSDDNLFVGDYHMNREAGEY